MATKESLDDQDPFRAQIDAFFGGLSYEDPLMCVGLGVNPPAIRVRGRYGIDRATSQRLYAADQLWVIDASGLADLALATSRMIYLGRGDAPAQYFINFDYDTGEFSVTGEGSAAFRGDPREELLAGLRIIAENETNP